MKRTFFLALQIFLLIFVSWNSAQAQSTDFTYQGRLLDNTLPPTANYDFEFRLFSTESGGAALGTIQRTGVSVADGVFTVKLDFGGQFTGGNRWLEVGVKTAGNPGGFQTLLPRIQATSAPYTIRSLNSAFADNALQLGGIAANQFVLTGDTRLADARNPLPGSANYIQNATSPQTTSNFNITGTGTADILNAATQYNIGGSRVLSVAGAGNLFTGVGAGQANTTGDSNSFFGAGAGTANINGSSNVIVGYFAGTSNTSGGNNTFLGLNAGIGNDVGSSNTFVGSGAGNSNLSGSNNTLIGTAARVNSNNLTFATAIGAGADVYSSNSIALGRDTGSDIVVVWGTIHLQTLGTAGTTALCRGGGLAIATCSSSLRYKTGVNTFLGGLDVVRQLRPISFAWKDGGMKDIGFAAEEVEKIEPLLTSLNDKGEIEGVKYDRITTVLVNAVNEQQQIIEKQQRQIVELKKLVCLSHPQADVCKQQQGEQ